MILRTGNIIFLISVKETSAYLHGQGPKGVAEATGTAIEEIVTHFHTYKKVDSHYIDTWYAGLNWNEGKVAEEYKLIEKTHNVGFTTENIG